MRIDIYDDIQTDMLNLLVPLYVDTWSGHGKSADQKFFFLETR